MRCTELCSGPGRLAVRFAVIAGVACCGAVSVWADHNRTDGDGARTPQGTGTLSGIVRTVSNIASPRMIDIAGSVDYQRMHRGKREISDRDLVVDDHGGLQNAFIWIHKGIPKAERDAFAFSGNAKVELRQRHCFYEPRVLALQVGQTLVITNQDCFTHNIRAFPSRNRLGRMAMAANRQPIERIFRRAERAIEISCDFHKPMRGFIFVMDHPFFAVTDKSGRFEISGLPPREYTVGVWHERFQDQRIQVDVTASEQTALDVLLTDLRVDK